MEPLTFRPLLKQIRWGGRKLGSELGKPIGDADDYAESWEIADQPGSQSVVETGKLAGLTLSELVSSCGEELLGTQHGVSQFPLLIKFLDANDWLSLQVHPNDEQAKTYNPQENGKTEAWIILHAEPGSQICAGLKQGVTREDFEHHLHNGSVEETLHMIPAIAGDCVYVPSGTVHALGPGILLAEVQQQSNMTFRLHDWGRLGSDGKPREIHVEESLACIDFDRGPVNPVTPEIITDGSNTVEDLVQCEHFAIRRHQIRSTAQLQLGNRFRILMALDGNTQVVTEEGTLNLTKGSTTLIPATVAEAQLTPQKEATLLEIMYP